MLKIGTDSAIEILRCLGNHYECFVCYKCQHHFTCMLGSLPPLGGLVLGVELRPDLHGQWRPRCRTSSTLTAQET